MSKRENSETMNRTQKAIRGGGAMGPIILACVILFSSACANPATDKPKAVVVTPATEAQSPRPAEAETLLITPANSKIEFTGSSPKEANHGSFRKFAGQIELVGEKPESSRVSVDIETGSIETEEAKL